MVDLTDRLELPLLAAGQSQKEILHNEALARLSSLVQPAVVAVALASPPSSPSPGQSWIVGSGATGAWSGRDGHLATWTSGGWRFVAPFEGMFVWSAADAKPVTYTGSVWEMGVVRAAQIRVGNLQVVGPQRPAISAPSGGATVDAEARAAIGNVLNALRTHGLIAP